MERSGAVVRRARLWAASGLRSAQDGSYLECRAAPVHLPGQLDNTVAGSQPAGIGLHDNLIKECAEEAASPALAMQAVEVSFVSYLNQSDMQLKPDLMTSSI